LSLICILLLRISVSFSNVRFGAELNLAARRRGGSGAASRLAVRLAARFVRVEIEPVVERDS
jgi:hypothetical protein